MCANFSLLWGLTKIAKPFAMPPVRGGGERVIKKMIPYKGTFADNLLTKADIISTNHYHVVIVMS